MAERVVRLMQTVKPTGLLIDDASAVADRLTKAQIDFQPGRYSPAEIREAIRDGYPVVAVFRGSGPRVLIGENSQSLLYKAEEGFREIADDAMRDAGYIGVSYVVTGVPDGAALDEEKAPAAADGAVPVGHSVLLYAPERDNWDSIYNDRKKYARERLLALQKCPRATLPTHPLIVLFRMADAKEREDHVQGFTLGAEATICDHDDPVTVILHELGHLYWSTRLRDMPDARQELEELWGRYSKMEKDQRPAIFVTDWSLKTSEEMFCTLYLWYCKGAVLSAGYRDILAAQCPEGLALLCSIFERVEAGYRVTEEWEEAETATARWAAAKAGVSLPVAGGRRVKMPPPALLKAMRFPSTVPHTLVGEQDDRRWVKLESGPGKGLLLVLKADRIDVDYMTKRKRWQRPPFRK